MTKIELQKAIAEALQATNVAEAKRMFTEVYYQVHPVTAPTLSWSRIEAGYYRTADGSYEIKEVPETKEHRYYWNVISENAVIGTAEILSTAKEIAEADKKNS